MAEPLDYFFQGANLGMRAGAARTQQEQFKTNLAERARQFDLNREIALGNLDLRQKEFTLRQENAVLDNELTQIQINDASAQSNELMRVLGDRKKFAPALQSYQTLLDKWNGIGEPPPAPEGLPLEVNKEAQNMRQNAANLAANNNVLKAQEKARATQQQMFASELSYLSNNRPDLIFLNPQTGLYDYNREDYLKVKRDEVDAKRALAARERRGPSLADRIQEFAENNAVKFYTEDPTSGKMVFDEVNFRKALAAAVGLGVDPDFEAGGSGSLINKPDEEVELSDFIGRASSDTISIRN